MKNNTNHVEFFILNYSQDYFGFKINLIFSKTIYNLDFNNFLSNLSNLVTNSKAMFEQFMKKF